MENKSRLKLLLERLVRVKNLASHWQLDSRARHYFCRICAQERIRIEVIVIKIDYVKAKLNSFEILLAFWLQSIKHCNACCGYMFVYRVYCAFATYCLEANKAKQSRQRFAMIKLNSAKNISLTDSKAEIELTLDELRNHTDLLYCPKVAVTFRRWSGHNIKHVTMVIAVWIICDKD